MARFSSSFTFILSASLSFTSLICFTSVLHPPHFSQDGICSWFPPRSFHGLSTTPSYLNPARHFLTFSRTAPSTIAGNTFSGMFLTLNGCFNFPTSLFVLNGYIPSSALSTVLLVVFEHPSTFGLLPSVLFTAVLRCVPFPYLLLRMGRCTHFMHGRRRMTIWYSSY